MAATSKKSIAEPICVNILTPGRGESSSEVIGVTTLRSGTAGDKGIIEKKKGGADGDRKAFVDWQGVTAEKRFITEPLSGH